MSTKNEEKSGGAVRVVNFLHRDNQRLDGETHIDEPKDHVQAHPCYDPRTPDRNGVGKSFESSCSDAQERDYVKSSASVVKLLPSYE